jgi:DNA polymerase III subunit beta
MQFSCESGELLKALTQAGGAIASRPLMQSLSNFKLDLSVEGLKVTGFDMTTAIISTVEVLSDGEGTWLVPADQLKRLVETLKGETLTVELSESVCRVGWGLAGLAGNYELPAIANGDYPELPTGRLGFPIEIPQEQLAIAVKAVASSICLDESRASLRGVCVTLSPTAIEFAATDGHRLNVATIAIAEQERSEQVVVPLEVLVQAVKAKTIVSVQLDPLSHIFVAKWTGCEMITRCFEQGGRSDYPQYQNLIPRSFKFTAQVDRAQWLSAINRAKLFGIKSKLEFESDRVNVATKGKEGSEGASENVPASLEGDALSTYLNPYYLSEALAVLPGKQVGLNANSATMPMTLTPTEPVAGLQIVLLIMPIGPGN